MTRSLPALIFVGLVIAACTVPVATPSPNEGQTGAPATATASPTRPAAVATGGTRYTATELFQLQIQPTAIAADASQVYVAEVALGAKPQGTLSKVVVVSVSGGTPAPVPGSDTPASVGITGLAVHDNALYLSEGSNSSVRLNGVFRLSSGTVTPVAGGPGAPADLSHGNGDGGPALNAALQGPWAIAFSVAGDLYVAEQGDSRLRVVRGQTITTYAGGNGCTTVGDINTPPTGTATTAKLCLAALVAVDPDGFVYLAELARATWIVRIDPSGVVSTISSSFAVTGLAIDRNGDLLAADATGDRIVRFARGHPDQMSVMVSGIGHIVALATAPDGSVYVANWQDHDPSQAVTYKITRLMPSP